MLRDIDERRDKMPRSMFIQRALLQVLRNNPPIAPEIVGVYHKHDQ